MSSNNVHPTQPINKFWHKRIVGDPTDACQPELRRRQFANPSWTPYQGAFDQKSVTQKYLPMALVLVVAMCVVAGTVAGDESRSPLQFDRNGRFRILQLTDLHFGEAPDKAWGPLQDVMSMQNMVALIEMERPDLVVLSGDQVTGNNINGNATAYHGQIVRVLERHGVKWALVFGNHDDAPLEGHVVGERFPTTTRAELMRFDRTFRGSYSQFGPSSVRGVSNYLLPIADSKGATRAVLYMLDSGGGSLDIAVDYSQVDWFESASRRQGLQAAPGLLFLHVPLPIVRRVWNEERWRCEGFKDDGIDVVRTRSPTVSRTVRRLTAHGLTDS